MSIWFFVIVLSMAQATFKMTQGFKPLSVLSWNVNGIRSFLKHDPSGNVLRSILEARKVDVLCLQETKIQVAHQNEIQLEFQSKFGVKRGYWSSSIARKGYSGTAVFMFDRNNENMELSTETVTYGIGDELGDLEGRSITIETDSYSLVNTYVPNSGAALAKLNYRTATWDTTLSMHINGLKARRPHLPVILTGDLNVAHTAWDYYNPHEARMKLQAGTTPEEQASFAATILQNTNLVDTFREQHPELRKYSYFGSRMGDRGRQEKLGMRLDYVLLSQPVGTHAPLKFTTYIEDEVKIYYRMLILL
jgi:exodeoxyribonuclease-3